MNNSFLLPAFDNFAAPAVQHPSRHCAVSFIAAALSVAIVFALYLTGRDALLRLAIPVLAMLIALSLYFTRPILYVQYSLWTWFLAPLVRRLVDWRFGYTEPNFVLLAPLLVSAVAAFTLILPNRRPSARIPVSFVLCGAAIFYGFVVGMALSPSAETVYGLFNWLCPMLFGLHLFFTWTQHQQYPAAISRVFLWAILLLGLYGLFQYFAPPIWDRYWLENNLLGGQSLSFGRPEPFQIRVWSTLNSPGPFANFMVVGLLLLFSLRSFVKLPAAIAGYFSLLLSLVRTAWLSWFVGLFVFLRKSNPRVIVRVLALGVLLILCLLPWINDPRVSHLLGDRLDTFSDVRQDDSFQQRLSMYRVLASDALAHPFGYGLSNETNLHDVAIDSGILSLLFSLGWIGTLAFASGVASMFLVSPASPAVNQDFPRVSKAIAIALLCQIVGGNIFVGVTGLLFWIFAAAHLAAMQLQPSAVASGVRDLAST
jgi:hypothetical protein